MKGNQFHRANRNHRPVVGADAHRGIAAFGQDGGSAAIEYAILLSLVVGGLLVASSLLGGATEDVFANVFSKSGSAANGSGEKSAVTANATGASESTGAGFLNLRLLAAELIAIVALGGLWWVTRAHRKRRELLGDDDEVPKLVATPKLQNRLFKKRQQIYRLLAVDMNSVLASRMEVRHVMSHHVTTVSPSTPAEDVRAMMESKKLRHLLVCDGGGNLVGILSDRDLAKSNLATAGELMTPDPITVRQDSLISPAVTLMIDRHISCLPVVDDDGQLVAVLTSTDLMMALQCALQVLHKVAGEIESRPAVPQVATDGASTRGNESTAAASEPEMEIASDVGAR